MVQRHIWWTGLLFLHWTLEQISKRTDEDDMKNCMRHCIDIDISSTIYGFAEGDKQNIHSISTNLYHKTWRTCTLLLHSVTVESYFHPRSSACCIEYKWLDRIPAAWSASAAPQLISGAEKIRDNPRDLRLTPLSPAIIFHLSSPVGSYIRRARHGCHCF